MLRMSPFWSLLIPHGISRQSYSSVSNNIEYSEMGWRLTVWLFRRSGSPDRGLGQDSIYCQERRNIHEQRQDCQREGIGAEPRVSWTLVPVITAEIALLVKKTDLAVVRVLLHTGFLVRSRCWRMRNERTKQLFAFVAQCSLGITAADWY